MKYFIMAVALFPLIAGATTTSKIKLSSNKVTITTQSNTVAVNAKEYNFLWDKLRQSIKGHHSFTGVQFLTDETKTEVDAKGIEKQSTVHHVFLGFKHSILPPVLIKVEQVRIQCPPVYVSGCTSKTKLSLFGPLTSYGAVTPLKRPEVLLKDKQIITWEIKPPSDSITLTGTFEITSLGFEDAVKALLENYSKMPFSLSQQQLLQMSARFLKSLNEEMLR